MRVVVLRGHIVLTLQCGSRELSSVSSGELHTAVDESGCPPWTYCPNSTSPCQCGSSVLIVT